MTKHGVWLASGHDSLTVASKALEHKYTHIWIMPGCSVSLNASGGEWSIQVSERHHKPATVSMWKRGTGKVSLIFLENTAWVEGTSAFKNISPNELIATINEVEKCIGVTISGSPGNTGWALLKKLHPEWIEETQVNLRDLHFTPKAGGDLVWQHKQLASIANGFKYIHKFDKNAAYPAAATMTDIGVGTPVHLEKEPAHRASVHEKGHPQEVGVWRCTIEYAPTYNPDMPPIWKEEKGSYEGSEGWLSGPIIRLLRSFGHQVIVHEGYVFPERHDLLVKWAKYLWDSRLESTTERVRKVYKQIPNTAIGFTAYKGFEDEDEKKRPDIRLQVVSRAREIMRWNIEKVYRQLGKSPCMVYMDAVYYFSNEEDGRAEFPTLVEREGKLGGFKYEGRIELTPDVLAMFDDRMNVADRLEVLNKKGWVK